MNRLTYRDDDGVAHIEIQEGLSKSEKDALNSKALERLAQYEDKGTSPENCLSVIEMGMTAITLERYKRWINDLQSGMYVNCVYCGHRYGPAKDTPVSMADALKAHIENCPAHPMSKLKTENALLKQRCDQEYLNGVKYAIYEIMKEADIYGSNTIRNSGDTVDGMCAQAAQTIKERMKPATRVLTLAELKKTLDECTPVVLEKKNDTVNVWVCSGAELYEELRDGWYGNNKWNQTSGEWNMEYGITWRCWNWRTANDERAATPWEEASAYSKD